MEFVVTTRAPLGKSEAKKIRRAGNVPAILYSRGEKGKDIVVDGAEFKKMLNTIDKGTLSSKIFILKHDGEKIRAILKDLQYDVTTYNVVHLDFNELHDKDPITLNIPIKCINIVDCVGVKLGGAVRQVIRYLRVRCLPKVIPSHFELDVRELNLGQILRLADIEIPSGVRPITNLKEVAVVVARR